MKEETKKYCKHCGELIDMDCIVCPKCGKGIDKGNAEETMRQGRYALIGIVLFIIIFTVLEAPLGKAVDAYENMLLNNMEIELSTERVVLYGDSQDVEISIHRKGYTDRCKIITEWNEAMVDCKLDPEIMINTNDTTLSITAKGIGETIVSIHIEGTNIYKNIAVICCSSDSEK